MPERPLSSRPACGESAMRTGRPSGVRGAGLLPGVFALQSPQKGVRGQKMCLHLASQVALEVIERMREEPVGPNLT